MSIGIEQGHLRIAEWRGVPLRLHWTTAAGALLFSGFRFEPGAWLGFVLLVLLHEMGHATLVMRYRLRVVSIDVHGYGGVCRWAGQATGWQRAVIAWGGVLAQALLLGVTYGVVVLLGPPRSLLVAQLVDVFTFTNIWLIGLNLLPFPPLDGAQAWRIFVEGRNRHGKARASRPAPVFEHEPANPELSREAAARVDELFERVTGKKP
jgi:stage IV sporulation protein FB